MGPFFSANSFLDQAVDNLDGLGADLDRFTADLVGLGQNRACPCIADHKPSRRKRRTGGGRTRGRSGWIMRVVWGEVGRGVGFGVGNVVLGCVARSRNQEGGCGGNCMAIDASDQSRIRILGADKGLVT